jgi:hypothetical protein
MLEETTNSFIEFVKAAKDLSSFRLSPCLGKRTLEMKLVGTRCRQWGAE